MTAYEKLFTKAVIFIIELPGRLPETFRNLPDCGLFAMHLRRPLTGPTCSASCSQVGHIIDPQVGVQVRPLKLAQQAQESRRMKA